jgi:hypothetical protein
VKDGIIYAGLILGFATLVTAHFALAGRMFLRQRPRWRGLVALVVPPLGVIWALKAGWRKLAFTWMAALVVYVVALIAARA